jgi:hypothetical protein
MRPGSCITTLIHFREFPAGSAGCYRAGVPRRVTWVPVFPGARFPVVAILVWRSFPPAAPFQHQTRSLSVWHQGGFGFARGANTTGIYAIAMLFVIWDVETLRRFASAV